MRFYGDGTDELHLALNVPFVFAELGDEMRAIVEQEEAVIPAEAWPTWTGSNHDAARFPTRWCDGDDRKIRAALVMLLTLRGTPILYYGDEIGMTDVAVPHDRLRDPVGLRGWPVDPGRDRARTPMPLDRRARRRLHAPGRGAVAPRRRRCSRNVAGQRDDPGSVLNLTRDLLSLRRGRADLRERRLCHGRGARRGLGLEAGRPHPRRDEPLGRGRSMSALGDGTVLLSTHRDRDR